MNKSDDISQLALALSKLQGEIKDAYKDRKGYGYQYADLSSVLDIIRPLSSKYRLSITQLPGAVGEKVSLETILMHESGQWISSTIEMPVQISKGMSMAQSTGAVLTYARRYALAAVFGIAQSDNDATHEDNSQDIRFDEQKHQKRNNLLRELQLVINDYQPPEEILSEWKKRENLDSIFDASDEYIKTLINGMRKKLEEMRNV